MTTSDLAARITAGLKGIQTAVGATPDGVIGPRTVEAIAAWLAPAPPPPPPVSPWTLYWQAGFGTGKPPELRLVDGPYGNPVGSGCLHTMQSGQVSFADGAMVVMAERRAVTSGGRTFPWVSGMFDTRGTGTFFPRYGLYEIEASLPADLGIWPGLWLRHRDGASVAEVDLAEVFQASAPGKVVQTLHLSGGRTNVAKTASGLTRGRHVFAVEILPVVPGKHDRVRFRYLLDGVEMLVYIDEQAAVWAEGGDPSRKWDIAGQIFVGGKYAGGVPAGLTSSQMIVHSIRVSIPAGGVA